jgi:hypothetical protein
VTTCTDKGLDLCLRTGHGRRRLLVGQTHRVEDPGNRARTPKQQTNYFFGRLAPYLERDCLRFLTP